MNRADALRQALGDTVRFGPMRERIEVLFETEARAWTQRPDGWMVIPLERKPAGFYLVSTDREGQRRGQEVLDAFLGPATAVLEPQTMSSDDGGADGILHSIGIRHLSYLRRTTESMDDMLERIEDAVATVDGKDARPRPVRPSHVDLLRDFRLALLGHNGRAAERALENLRLTGRLSAENLRFLDVELLGRLERWKELQALPYLQEMLRARRPRAVNEILLQMLWWTELAERCIGGQSADEVYAQVELGARFGTLLNAVDIPITEAGRSVAIVTATAQGDRGRVERLLGAVAVDGERERLERLAAGADTVAHVSAVHSIQDLFDQAQYGAVTRAFLEAPDPAAADLAVQAVLEAGEANESAPAVLSAVRGFEAEGRLRPNRRLQRDLSELDRLVDGTCGGWVEWSARLARERWPDADHVLRSQHTQWAGLETLSEPDLQHLANQVLAAWGGDNKEQVKRALDVLCRSVAEAVDTMRSDAFFDTVLILLADQPNLSEPVRDAYLLLVKRFLACGPAESDYQERLSETSRLWTLIASPAAVDWGLSLVDVLLYAPCPEPAARLAVISEVLGTCQSFEQRLSARQQLELEVLGDEAGVPVRRAPTDTSDAGSVWKRLDGAVVGLYSLQPRAQALLANRLSRLCHPKKIDVNSDKVATASLRALAERADYLIVDIWHAKHAATDAIDEVRPKSEQIMPRGQGITGLVQALEEHLSATDGAAHAVRR
ncbi:protein DpdD [Allonocardiopsis opalescens]|uniref:Uncharacterized protein n=1 Tax=Allonocardiopsis opalescens TaxID=1144618 RepID=A0A2T0Q2I3_9ACTN|nr:protein DpdD [Allonocardiopsis opalescens]PRX98007.1 hypothetical protein CLV72_105360 [Allonocardiopsis opalescens]